MTRIFGLALAGVLFCATSGVVIAGDETKHAEIDKPAPGFALADQNGKEYSLSDFKGRYVVLEWTNPDCPFVRKHYDSGNMQSLQKAYAKKGVVWLSICSSAPGKQGYYQGADITKQIEGKKGMQLAYLVDADGSVGRMYGAKTTPHMFVIDDDGVLIYAGGIDDKPSTNTADIDGATNYVQQCLDAAMSGKPVPTKTSTPYGCSIKYATTDNAKKSDA